eukprot:SAG22_NODE_1084_length_5637_cov_2.170820_6_plen_230_part_00
MRAAQALAVQKAAKDRKKRARGKAGNYSEQRARGESIKDDENIGDFIGAMDADDSDDSWTADEAEEEHHRTVNENNQKLLDALELQEHEDDKHSFRCPGFCCAPLTDLKRPYCLKMVNEEEEEDDTGETKLQYRVTRRGCVRFNVFWINLCRGNVFQGIVLAAILTATGLIGARTYAKDDEEASLAKALDSADLVITVIFIIEILIKMLAKGPVLYIFPLLSSLRPYVV